MIINHWTDHNSWIFVPYILYKPSSFHPLFKAWFIRVSPGFCDFSVSGVIATWKSFELLNTFGSITIEDILVNEHESLCFMFDDFKPSSVNIWDNKSSMYKITYLKIGFMGAVFLARWEALFSKDILHIGYSTPPDFHRPESSLTIADRTLSSIFIARVSETQTWTPFWPEKTQRRCSNLKFVRSVLSRNLMAITI